MERDLLFVLDPCSEEHIDEKCPTLFNIRSSCQVIDAKVICDYSGCLNDHYTPLVPGDFKAGCASKNNKKNRNEII